MANYNFTSIDYPGSSGTYVSGINASGVIAGSYSTNLGQYGFSGTLGSFTQLNSPAQSSYINVNISDGGELYGMYYDSGSKEHAFVNNNGIKIDISPPGASYTFIGGVSDSGQVVGGYYTNSGPGGYFTEKDGVYSTISIQGASQTQISSINSSGTIVGSYSDSIGTHGYYQTAGVLTKISDPAGATITAPTGINAAGVIYGFYNDSQGKEHAFLYNNGALTSINVVNAKYTYVSDVSNSGQAVGYYSDGAHYHGFVYENGNYTSVDIPGSTDTYIYGVSDTGQFVGTYVDAGGGQHSFSAVAPNPTTLSEQVSVLAGAAVTGTGSLTGTGALAGASDPNGYSLSILNVTGGKVGQAVAGAYGHLTLNADGSYSYAADNASAISAGPTGSHLHDVFQYTVSNGHGGTAASSLDITLNRAPVVSAETGSVISAGTIQGTAGTSGTGALAQDTDPDNDALSVSAIQGGKVGQAVAGAYGHLTLNADGSYAYIADNASGLTATAHDTFSYTVSDGQGGATAASLDISVQPEHLNAVYRFYAPATGEHFYTTDAYEKASIQANLPNFTYEGAKWATPDKSALTEDVFRFLDTKSGTHFYTADAHERDVIQNTLPNYHYEGVAFEAYINPAASGGLTLERFYNTQSNQHHFAADAREAYGINHGEAGPNWVDEGPGLNVHVPTDGMLHV